MIRQNSTIETYITIGSFPHSWLITGFITIVTRRVLHVEQELLTLPEHLSSPSVSSFVRVARSLVFCVMFCGSLFCPFVPFSFGHCIVCPLSLMASDYHFGILLKLFFSLCPFFAWSLYCRSFFDLRPLIAAFGMFKHFFAALSKLTFEKPRLYLLDV